MATNTSVFGQGYNSFSGVDIKAVFANVVIGELQGISYSVTREKAPIYTMGQADPRAFSRGKRGIAGTLIFVVFDRHAILGTLGGLAPGGQGLVFQSDIDDIFPDFSAATTGNLTGSPLGSSSGTTPADTVQNQESPISNAGGDQELAYPWYADQIPPFDISLAAANEMGHLAVMRIFGVELLNEGSGVSVDDIVIEQQHTWVGRTIIPWTPVKSDNASAVTNQAGVST